MPQYSLHVPEIARLRLKGLKQDFGVWYGPRLVGTKGVARIVQRFPALAQGIVAPLLPQQDKGRGGRDVPGQLRDTMIIHFCATTISPTKGLSSDIDLIRPLE